MSYRPDFDNSSEWPDDIDRLFDLIGQQDPPPGRAFDGTVETLRSWHESAVAPVKTSMLVSLWSSFSLVKITVTAGLCLVLITVGWITWANSNQASGQNAKQGTVLVISKSEAETKSSYPFTATVEMAENDLPTVPKYVRQPTQATNQLSSTASGSKNSNLDRLARLELSISGSSLISTHENRNDDNSQLRRSSNLH